MLGCLEVARDVVVLEFSGCQDHNKQPERQAGETPKPP